MTKLVIFDLDGVLIDSKDYHFDAFNLSLPDEYRITREEHVSIYDGLPTKRKLELLTKNKGLSSNLYDLIWKKKQEETLNLFNKYVQRDYELMSYFKQLSDNGYKIAVASNSIRNTVKILLLRLGVLEFVDIYISNEDVTKNKPFPEMYWKCMIAMDALPDNTVIVEDSHIGRQGALDSKAHLVCVDNRKDLNQNKIDEIKSLLSLEKKMVAWESKNLNVLIPMAGRGSRFEANGYTFPKPLIEIVNKPMIEVVVNNLNIKANYIFIVQKEHYERYNLKYLLNLIAPDCKIVQVDEITEGAACTTLLAKKYIDNDAPLLTANCDQFIEWDSNETLYTFNNDDSDASILTFKATGNKWSYAKLGENGYVSEVAEKNPISNNATCLHYNTSVLLSNGKTEIIGKIVNTQMDVEVMSYNESLKIFESKKITGYIRKEGPNDNWYKLSCKHNRLTNNKEKQSIFITGDHQVLIESEWKEVQQLCPNDKIKTKYLIPNKLQKEFIDGTLLGDGFYKKPNSYGELGRLVIKQSKKQIDWFNVKKDVISCFGGTERFEDGGKYFILGKETNSSGSCRFNVSSNPYFSEQRIRWYPNGKKIVPRDLILTPLMLSIWYMDDGSLGSSEERLVLCTDSFSIEDNYFLTEQLKSNYGIVSNIDKRNRIVISNGSKHNGHMSAFKFFDLVAPYIIPSMQYKIPQIFWESYDHSKYIFGTPEILDSVVIVEKMDKNDTRLIKHPYHYCLEIEDNHNFIAGNMVVSNCGAYYWKHGSDYVKYAEQMISKNIRTNNEFYICPVFNEAIADGKKVRIKEVEKMWGIGTPEDLDYFLSNYDLSRI